MEWNASWNAKTFAAPTNTVITSYSIHYTKLYEVYFPWKSTEAGRMDKLVATIQGTPVDSVFYMRESMNMVMRAPGTESNQMQLMITGLGHEDEDELLAYYTQTEGSDSTARTTNYLAGKAALVAYDRQVMDLVLVARNNFV